MPPSFWFRGFQKRQMGRNFPIASDTPGPVSGCLRIGILFALNPRVMPDSIERAATAIPMTAPQDYSVI